MMADAETASALAVEDPDIYTRLLELYRAALKEVRDR